MQISSASRPPLAQPLTLPAESPASWHFQAALVHQQESKLNFSLTYRQVSLNEALTRSKGYVRLLNAEPASWLTRHCAGTRLCTRSQTHAQSWSGGAEPEGNSFKIQSNSDVCLNSRKSLDAGGSQTAAQVDPIRGYLYPLVSTFFPPLISPWVWELFISSSFVQNTSIFIVPFGHLHLHHRPSQPCSISVHARVYNALLAALLGTAVLEITRATFPSVVGYTSIDKFSSATEGYQ